LLSEPLWKKGYTVSVYLYLYTNVKNNTKKIKVCTLIVTAKSPADILLNREVDLVHGNNLHCV
jgi:hypothetical protein